MSKESIKASINTYIKENGNLAITGQILNSVMNEMVDGLASEEELAAKQDALTLTIKDNGNIVLANIQGQSQEFMPATPSGDPMHYAYEAAGAVWNGTGADIVKTAPWADMVDDDADKVVTHKAGYWYLNGLGDITNEQMRTIFLDTNNFLATIQSVAIGYYTQMLCRVNLPLLEYKITLWRLRVNYADCFRSCLNLEAIVIPEYRNGTVPDYCFRPSNMQTMFAYDSVLKHISGLINVVSCENVSNPFLRCYELRTVKLYAIKLSIVFSDSPKLTSKSILYMITNEAATSAITITLHADAYARAMANADIVAALQAHPNVSLASA